MNITKCVNGLIFISLFFVIFVDPSPAGACSCIIPGSSAEEFTERDAIFTGKVIRVADNYAPYFSTIDYVLYKLGSRHSLLGYFFLNYERLYGFDVFFKVLNSWKGVDKTFVKVNTGRGGGDCGYSFILDQEYLVYASYAYGIPNNYWVTSICSRNAILPKATEDLNYLSTLPEMKLRFTAPIPWADRETITVVLAMAILGIFIFVRQHRKNRKAGVFRV
jgi:hypothetical protein